MEARCEAPSASSDSESIEPSLTEHPLLGAGIHAVPLREPDANADRQREGQREPAAETGVKLFPSPTPGASFCQATADSEARAAGRRQASAERKADACWPRTGEVAPCSSLQRRTLELPCLAEPRMSSSVAGPTSRPKRPAQ